MLQDCAIHALNTINNPETLRSCEREYVSSRAGKAAF